MHNIVYVIRRFPLRGVAKFYWKHLLWPGILVHYQSSIIQLTTHTFKQVSKISYSALIIFSFSPLCSKYMLLENCILTALLEYLMHLQMFHKDVSWVGNKKSPQNYVSPLKVKPSHCICPIIRILMSGRTVVEQLKKALSYSEILNTVCMQTLSLILSVCYTATCYLSLSHVSEAMWCTLPNAA